jgi:hypothetical protein
LCVKSIKEKEYCRFVAFADYDSKYICSLFSRSLIKDGKKGRITPCPECMQAREEAKDE